MKAPREQDILNQCLAWLRLQGWFAWRNNTGARKIGKHFVRWGVPGSADILALRNGVFLSLEIKRPGSRTHKVRKAQQEQWADEVRRHGGLALTVRSLDELRQLLEEAGT